MPINEKLIKSEILNNTLKREIWPEIKIVSQPKMGKVRSVYDIGDGTMLMVSSDNLSTHDIVHRRQVYAKGENLDAISSYYFEQTKYIIRNHFLKTVAPNTWLVEKTHPMLVEMVFRKYLTGSGWKSYKEADGPKKGMEFCGVKLRPGYRENERLDEVIFTPTGKGQVKNFDIPEFRGLNTEDDDPKLTLEVIRKNYKTFGFRRPEDIDCVIDASFNLYSFINSDLESRGTLLADTKWEFGYLPDGRIRLIDECVTPDSSRFWKKENYVFDSATNKFLIVQEDKQPFRDYIEKLGLHKDKETLAKHWMADDVLKAGVIRYCNIREKITGTLPVITPKLKKEIILEVLGNAGYLR